MNADLHAAAMRKGCPCEKRTIGRREVIVAPDPDCPRHGIREGVASIPHLRRHARNGEDDRTAEARLYGEALRVVYRYHWANNPRRAELKGRECVVEAQNQPIQGGHDDRAARRPPPRGPRDVRPDRPRGGPRGLPP